MPVRLRLPPYSQQFSPTLSWSNVKPPGAGLGSREELLNRVFPDEIESLGARPRLLLHIALLDYLPRLVRMYRTYRTDILPGWHLVHFPTKARSSHLQPDGTDSFHAPDESYKYRVWAGGSIDFQDREPLGLIPTSFATLRQKIVHVGGTPGRSSKVWVRVRRWIELIPKQRPEGRRIDGAPEGESSDKPAIVEDRLLLFYQDKPNIDVTTVKPPPTDPSFSLSMTTTKALLFRFSALTYNAHAIHLDPEYARKEYGIPGLLVHGPLTLILMLEVLARGLQRWGSKTRQISSYLMVKNITYQNVAPIFVDEEMLICCKQTKQDDTTEASDVREWQVWIQKLVNGQPSVCVTGTVQVGGYMRVKEEGVDMKHIPLENDDHLEEDTDGDSDPESIVSNTSDENSNPTSVSWTPSIENSNSNSTSASGTLLDENPISTSSPPNLSFSRIFDVDGVTPDEDGGIFTDSNVKGAKSKEKTPVGNGHKIPKSNVTADLIDILKINKRGGGGREK